ncbi:MAG: carbohydrate ABC transporter permease [Oscillospiraceae bacterium]|nr:carbohydrate ABC transporter permease [Oscillospiraceae bacterium]
MTVKEKTMPRLSPSRVQQLRHRYRRIGGRLLLYFLMIGVGVVFLHPILYMLAGSFKTVADLVNPGVEWIPSGLYTGNYSRAAAALDYGKSLGFTTAYTAAATVLQTFSCALAGYSLARHRFPLKRLWMAMIVLTFLIPANITLIPRYLQFFNYGFIDSPAAMLVPAAFGQGVNSAIFILVFNQFFSGYPPSFDEAAQIDGAGRLTVFARIALPICAPAIVVSLLFSFVWFWNETYNTALLMGESWRTLPIKLDSFVELFNNVHESAATGLGRINEGLTLAATVLVIAPLVVIYLVLQRRFIEGVEATGLTGE